MSSYEGPPTANGRPGGAPRVGVGFQGYLSRAYKTMRGYHVSRRGGWDTHGLPVEIEVEKKLGFNNKQQIEEYGIDQVQRALPAIGIHLHPGLGETHRTASAIGSI